MEQLQKQYQQTLEKYERVRGKDDMMAKLLKLQLERLVHKMKTMKKL